MRKSTTLTQFIQEISVLLDKGSIRTIAEVHEHIERKDVIDWIESEFPIDANGADFSMFEERHRSYIHEFMYELWEVRAGDERRKWGIENNGLCLLISWATEHIRQDFNSDAFIEKTI
ncbi:hypothetical protein AB4Z17_08500 [Paenibacillus sp. TAF43_2]|uniref:hypothetical protein n=1 Tax=Paenibacillus sp. TAF43_2 TaxID=3233069 RepID=UPI003F9A370F